MSPATYKMMVDIFFYKKNVRLFIVLISALLGLLIAATSATIVFKIKKQSREMDDIRDSSYLVATLDTIFENSFSTIRHFSGKSCDEHMLTDMRDAVESSAYVRSLGLLDTAGNMVCSTSRGDYFIPLAKLTQPIAHVIQKMNAEKKARAELSLIDGTHIVPDKEALVLYTLLPAGMGLGTIDASLIARTLISRSHDAVQPFLVIGGKKLNAHGEILVDSFSDAEVEVQSLNYPYKIRIEKVNRTYFSVTLTIFLVFVVSGIMGFFLTYQCTKMFFSSARCLSHALRTGGISADVQPVFIMDNRKPVGMEVLARWVLNDGRRIPPSEFIAVAERSGDINKIAENLITLIATKIDSGALVVPEGFRVGFNIHPSHFKSQSLIALCESFTSKVNRFGVRMVLELTERGELEKDNETLLIIKAIKSLGVELAIDDFGASSSGLRYLSDSFFDCIKIDRSFLEEASENKDTGIVLQNSIALAHKLGKDIVVEGIENDRQLTMLRKAFPAYALMIQGYLWAKPFPVNVFNEWYAFQRTSGKRFPDNE
ncbi:EAL domain-containing protein [Pantoea ananatis]|uniref:EAL domain-containing protein n=1 Tax=Pantoea ananas TaxID=553 RepID=UPI003FA46E8C